MLFSMGFLDYKKYPVFAIENQYSNQLLKVNIEKSDADTVNIKVYSSKPYPIELSPIKKGENEYIIFLPETYHSITSKPNITPYADDIKDVDIKLVPYISSNINNGYTKITIKTNKENLKLNVDNEVSYQDIKFQEELSTILLKKTAGPLKLRPKKDISTNIKKTSNVNVKSQNVISQKGTKTVTQAKVIDKKEFLKQSSNNSQENQEKSVKQSNPKTVLKDQNDSKKISETVVETSKTEKNQPNNSDDKAKPDNIKVTENSTSVEIPVSAENTTLQVEPNKIADNSANTNELPATKVSDSANKAKKSNPIFNMLIPILISIILVLIVFKIIKRIINKQNDIPIKIMQQAEDEFQPEQENNQEEFYKDDTEIEINSDKPEFEPDINSESDPELQQKSQKYTEDIIAKSQINNNKLQNNKSDDILERLSENPLKPLQPNPLKNREYTEISPDQLDKEYYNIKANKNSSIDDKKTGDIKFIAGIEVEDERAFYLVQLENKKALVGVIGSEIFILNKFDRIKNPKFIVRKASHEESPDRNVYFVQVGTWCGLVSSEKDGMKLETVF